MILTKHFKKNLLTVLSFLFLISVVNANDSTLLKLKDKAYSALIENSLDSARFFYKKIIKEYPNHPRMVGVSYNNLGIIDYREGFNVRALDYFEKTLTVYRNNGVDSLIAQSLYNNGTIYKQLGQYDKATDLLLSATKIFEKNQMNDDLSKAYNVLANLKKRTNDFNKALEYHNKAIEFAKINSDSSLLISFINNRGITFLEMEFFAEAKRDFLAALQFKLANNKRKSSSYTYFNLGKTEFLRSNLDSSEQYFNKALQIYSEFNVQSEISYTLNYLASISSSKSNFTKAKNLFLESEKIAEKLGELDLLLTNYNFQFKFYEVRKNFEEALLYSKKYNVIYKKILNSEKVEAINELQIKYDVNKKEQENVLLIKQNEIDELKIKRQDSFIKNLEIISLISVVIILLAAYLIYRIYTISKREKELAHKEKQFNLEQHHRIKNHLQTLSSLLNLQITSIENEVAKEVIQESKTRIDVVKLLHKNFYDNNSVVNPLINLGIYLKDIIENLQFLFKMDKVHISLELENLSIKPDKVISIGIITNEIVTNAFKYGLENDSESVLKVKLSNSREYFELIIFDNGGGIPLNSVPSVGSKLIKQLSKQIDAKLEVRSDQGTYYKISFKT